MSRTRPIALVLVSVALGLLACSIPPEVIDAIYRLPTPTATATPVPSERLYVSKSGADENDCTTQATACLTINAAIEKAADGAAIHIGPGTYAENDGHSLDVAAAIYSKNLNLYGTRGDGGYPTVISGSGPLYVLAVTGEVEVVIEDIALSNGRWGLLVGNGARVTLRNAEIRETSWEAVRLTRPSTVVLENVRIEGNPEGAIHNDYGDLTIQGSLITGNGTRSEARARELGHPKAVIHNQGTLRIVDSTIAGNEDDEGEHNLLLFNSGSLTIERSTISGNRMGRGATIYNYPSGTAVLENTTLSGNSGVGISSFGDLRLSYSTISNNLGGLFANSGEADPMTLRLENSILENNAEQDCYFALRHATVFDRRGRNLSDGSCDFDYGGNFPRPPEGDAFLGPLADNGGPTQTHALLDGNRGIDAAVGPCLATDQRGIGRPVGGGCDVGAYESEFALLAATPAGTPIPIRTETPTPAPDIPLVGTLTQNANCRRGPGTAYAVVTSLLQDQSVQIDGQNSGEPKWWWILLPQSTAHCWVSAAIVKIDGLFAAPPIVAAPAPPQPTEAQQVQGCLHQGPNDNQPTCYAPCPANPNPGGACSP